MRPPSAGEETSRVSLAPVLLCVCVPVVVLTSVGACSFPPELAWGCPPGDAGGVDCCGFWPLFSGSCSSLASSSLRLSCSSFDLTTANAIVAATTTAKRPVTPTSSARLVGNRSLSRMPRKARPTAAITRTIPSTKKKLPSIRRGSYPWGRPEVRSGSAKSGRLAKAPLRRPDGVVGEVQRIAAPDQEAEGTLAFPLRATAHAPANKQRSRPLELRLLILAAERRVDVLSRDTPPRERPLDPIRPPTGQQPLVIGVAAGEARVVDRPGLDEQGDHVLDLCVLHPALGQPAAQLGLGALLVPERPERELVGVLGHSAYAAFLSGFLTALTASSAFFASASFSVSGRASASASAPTPSFP